MGNSIFVFKTTLFRVAYKGIFLFAPSCLLYVLFTNNSLETVNIEHNMKWFSPNLSPFDHICQHLLNNSWCRKELFTLHEGREIREKEISGINGRLVWAANHYYCGWEAALAAVEIKDYGKIRRRCRWTPEIVRDRIREMYKAGERLDAAGIMENDRRLLYAGDRHFGTWRDAVIAAGIDYMEVCVNLKWTEDDVIGEIQRTKADGGALVSTVVCRVNERLFSAGVSRFGSWEKVVRTAGTDYDEYRTMRRLSREKVIAAL